MQNQPDRRAVLTASMAGAGAMAVGGSAGASTPAAQTADVIVVGGGFSGLAAARALKAAGRRVVVLEARDRVGGRVKPGRIAGVTIDLGGMWLGAGLMERLVGDPAASTPPAQQAGPPGQPLAP